MNQFTLLLVGIFVLTLGSVLGYYARQSIAKKQAGTLEAKLQKKVLKAKQESETVLAETEEKAKQLLESAKKETDDRRYEVLKTERLLLKRENILDQKISILERDKKEFQEK